MRTLLVCVIAIYSCLGCHKFYEVPDCNICDISQGFADGDYLLTRAKRFAERTWPDGEARMNGRRIYFAGTVEQEKPDSLTYRKNIVDVYFNKAYSELFLDYDGKEPLSGYMEFSLHFYNASTNKTDTIVFNYFFYQ